MPEPRRFRAPGRVNLIGEHTDTTDGLVLPAAIDRAVTLEAVLGGDVISLSSDAEPDVVRVAADGSDAPERGWGRYVAAVAAELHAEGRPPIGLDGRITSDLPREAGLSSSAALEISVALALLAAAGMELDPLGLAALCRRAEHRAVGVPSGIMDQAASVLGRAGHAVLLDCGTLDHRAVRLPSALALLVLDSGVRRELAGSGYARRVEEVRAALPALGGRRPADVRPDELSELLRDAEDVPARRLRHVVTENDRVRRAVGALESADVDALGAIFAAGHASLRDDFEVTIPELDALVELAMAHGAVAARMTGGGFGGAVVALVAADDADAIGAAVIDAYAGRHPGRAGSYLVCAAADGAGEVTGR